MEIDYEKELQLLEEKESELMKKYESYCNEFNRMLREDVAAKKRFEEKQQNSKNVVVIGAIIGIMALIYLMINF